MTIFTLFALACQNKKQQIISLPENPEIIFLASPIELNIDTTDVYLADFFTDTKKIDSINCPQNLKMEKVDGFNQIRLITVSDSLSPFSVLDVYSGGYKYSVLLRKSRKIQYEFTFNPKKKKYTTVNLMGEVNAWNPGNNPLTFANGVWKTTLTVESGIYQYLLVIDGKQQLDPTNKDSVSNNMGGFNSLLKIGKVDNTKLPYLTTVADKQTSFTISVSNKPKNLIAFYENYQLPDSYISKTDSTYEITIPGQATGLKRSYIRIWAYNENGISNDLKIPLNYGKILTNTDSLTRQDYEAAVIYNVFVDRFFDGNPKNNRPLNKPKVVLPKADYMGGDIAGITKQLNAGYFDSLGVNTLWVSPIVKNVEGAYGFWKKPKTKFSAYHGYWPISFTEIDNRFGTPQELNALVSDLHNGNKNIIIDFVAHHVHIESPFYKQHKNQVTNLYLPDGTLNTERWDDYRLTTWFDVFLPTLDNSNPEVANIVSDSAVWWLKTYNLDGFRHDAAKHVPLSFWRLLTFKVKRQVEIPENRKTYQIGETYGTPELISSYVNSGMLDGQFDFNVYDAVSTALSVGNSFKNVQTVLSTSFKYYGWHNLMGYITGNQDRGRFISYAGGTLHYDEDAKAAGWTRNIEVGDKVAYKKSAMLFAFISTIPGIPVVYYGDEIGMPGGNDPDNRRMMIFNNLNSDQQTLKATASKLLNLRRSNIALIYGDFKFLYVDDKVMVYQRTYFGKVVVVAFNNSNDTKTISVILDKNIDYSTVKSLFGNTSKINGNKLEIAMAPYTFEILTN